MAQAWLIAVFVFICLRPGGDAIKCHNCMVESSSEKCSETCTEEGGLCATATVRRIRGPGGPIGKSCVPRNYMFCGKLRRDIKPGYLVDYTCCDKSDFCNS